MPAVPSDDWSWLIDKLLVPSLLFVGGQLELIRRSTGKSLGTITAKLGTVTDQLDAMGNRLTRVETATEAHSVEDEARFREIKDDIRELRRLGGNGVAH